MTSCVVERCVRLAVDICDSPRCVRGCLTLLPRARPPYESVDRAGLRDPDAVDPERAAEGVEMAVVVQNARATSGGRRGDQIIGCWDASLASQLARGGECRRAGAAGDMGCGQCGQ